MNFFNLVEQMQSNHFWSWSWL